MVCQGPEGLDERLLTGSLLLLACCCGDLKGSWDVVALSMYSQPGSSIPLHLVVCQMCEDAADTKGCMHLECITGHDDCGAGGNELSAGASCHVGWGKDTRTFSLLRARGPEPR